MFRVIIALLIFAIAGLVATLLVQSDPGSVAILYAGFEVETSLAFFLVLMVIAMIILQLLFRFILIIWRLPVSMKQLSQSRRFAKSRGLLNQGLIDLAEGRFDQAEKNLIKLVAYSESPLLHYLAAARAAQLQGKHDERDHYLKAAHEAKPEAEIAIGVTQAELQLAHQQNEQALATLTHLRSIAPRHDYILMLLARAYYGLEDWQALLEILPEVRRKALIVDPRLREMEVRTYQYVLDSIAVRGDAAELEKAWNKIPKANRGEQLILIHYIRLMHQHHIDIQHAESLMVAALKLQWNDDLIELYGQFETRDANVQLAQAEKWLTDYAWSETLLLALGRICIRAHLWGKAQGYLESSINTRATPAACLALANLFEQHLPEKDRAAEYYKMGLLLSAAATT